MSTRPSWYPDDPHLVWQPYTQMATAAPPIPVERARGAYLETSDGRRILDAISSWWVTLHGHCEPAIQAAIAEQAARLDQVIFAGFTHEPGARLAAELRRITPSSLQHVFYSDNGSTAVEVALKMAFQYWRNLGQPGRTRFVTLANSYHGDTLGAMSAGAVGVFHDVFRPLMFESTSVADADALDRVLESDGDEIAALIIEPMVQGAGGMILWPADFLLRARRACDRHGVLLIVDEVFTGFGRTGKLFASEHGPIEPDIMCLSKAITGGVLPFAATLASDAVYEAFLGEDRLRTLFHGHSFTGNPISCAAALASLELLESRGLERVREIETIHRRRIARISTRDDVSGAGVLGLIARFEIAPEGREGGYLDAIGPRLAREFLERNVLLRPLGNIVYAVPPLAANDEDIERLHDVIEEVLDLLGRG